MWNDLNEFTQWYKDNNHPFKPQARDPLYVTKWTTSVVIFRQDRYQVELFYMKPNSVIPSVAAQGVEHKTIFLHGAVKGLKNDEVVFDTMPHALIKNKDGESRLYNMIFEGNHSDVDVVVVGAQGASVMVVQRWDNDIEMTSISKQRGFLD